MSDHPAWEILAKTLVEVQLRIVLAQQAQEATGDADDRDALLELALWVRCLPVLVIERAREHGEDGAS